MLGRLFNKIKNLDFYLKALLIAVPITGILLAYLLSIGAADLIFSNWFITLISVPTFIANQLSSAAYFGRVTELFSYIKKKMIKGHQYELIGTVIGMCAGIAVGIGLAIMNVTVPLASSLFGFATVLFTLRQMNIFAGLGNRAGRCADTGKDSRPVSEKAIIATSGLLGLALGITLFATCTAAMVSVVGVTSFFSGGAAIPIWIAGIIFILSVSSGFASSADYASKSISFVRSHFISPGKVTETVEKRKFEYGGSLAGITIGLIIGAIVVGAIVASNPPLLAGIVGVVAGVLIIVTCVGVIGSIASRVGRLIDGFNQKEEGEQNFHAAMQPTFTKRPDPEESNLDITPRLAATIPAEPDVTKRQNPANRRTFPCYTSQKDKALSNKVSSYKNSFFYTTTSFLNRDSLKNKPSFSHPPVLKRASSR